MARVKAFEDEGILFGGGNERLALKRARQTENGGPLPQLRIFRPTTLKPARTATGIEYDDLHNNICSWEDEITKMARANRGKGAPVLHGLMHVTYVDDQAMKRMLAHKNSDYVTSGGRRKLLSYMDGFSHEYGEMVKDRAARIIALQNDFLQQRIDGYEAPNPDIMVGFWGYLRLEALPNLEEVGNTKLAVVFCENELLDDEMAATRGFLAHHGLKINLIDSADTNAVDQPHMTMYETEQTLGMVALVPPDLPCFITLNPPQAHVNRNTLSSH